MPFNGEPSAEKPGYVVEFESRVPEPASMTLLGLGAATLLRRRSKA